MSKPFKLSSVLYGHSLDVRSVAVTPDNSIISGSRDKTAKFWRSNMFNAGYTESVTYKDQKNFVAAVLYLMGSQEYPDGLVVTGGNDNAILIYKPHEPFASFTIKEHTNTVCCLSAGLEPGTFLSGSWDMTAKGWNLKNLNAAVVTFSGHAASVWSVVQLGNGNVATACADKTIGIWAMDGQRMRLLTAHTDCVRGLADFPDLGHFKSVANDATIRVWTYDGECVETLYGHSNYIYSIARNLSCGDNSFVTSDEDRTVRFWVDGSNVQSIFLPAQSVWTVGCLSNGDVVTGSSDGVVRIFTQDEGRYASSEALKNYEEEVNALQKQACQEIGGYKVSDLPGREALYDPGKKAGQMKMIREGGQVVAYTWVEDGENSHWEKVGEVLGGTDKANEGKTMFEGQSYDYVFSVDVEDGKPPLKLPYNKGEDVYTAAHKFLSRHDLPAVYLDQVVEFIMKNSQESNPIPAGSGYQDPFTGASRYTPSSTGPTFGNSGTNVDPFTGSSSYSTSASVPRSAPTFEMSQPNADPFTGHSSYTTQQGMQTSYFPHTTYLKFEAGDPKVILNKLKEFNQKVAEGGCRIDDNKLEEVVVLSTEPCGNDGTINTLFTLLDWPEDVLFPVIDVVRLAVRVPKNNRLITMRENGHIIQKLKACISKDCKVPNNMLVAFRTLCNLFSHPEGEQLIYVNKIDLLEDISSLTKTNKNIEIGIATFLLNLTILILKQTCEVGLVVLADVIPDIVTTMTDPEAQFRALVALGTLIIKSDAGQQSAVRSRVLDNKSFVSHLQSCGGQCENDVQLKLKKCASQVQSVLLK